MDEESRIEYRFIRDATLVDFEIAETEVKPTIGDEDFHVRIVLKVEEDEMETSAFALVFTLGALSFHDGRPRGFSGEHFEDKDEWTSTDMLDGLQYRDGNLHFYADYVRGRCVKTRIDITSDGRLVLETVNRGQAATRWISKLKGEKTLRAV